MVTLAYFTNAPYAVGIGGERFYKGENTSLNRVKGSTIAIKLPKKCVEDSFSWRASVYKLNPTDIEDSVQDDGEWATFP